MGKKALTPDTQLTFTCFLKKRVLIDELLYYGPEGVVYIFYKLNILSSHKYKINNLLELVILKMLTKFVNII